MGASGGARVTVQLLPPVSSSAAPFHINEPRPTALTEAPNYLRSRNATRWHRARAGIARADGRISYQYWCGQLAYGGRVLGVEDKPPRDLLCGTCEGRAIGAGQVTRRGMTRLVFSPRDVAPPIACPGGKPYRETLYTQLTEDDWRNGRCLVCGYIGKLRAHGGPYRGGVKLESHPPGPDLLPACEFHGWRELIAALDTTGQRIVVCRCQVRMDP